MPFDSNGIFSLTPGYLAVTGETIQPTQHNPPLEDIAAQGLSAVLPRDGRAPMIGNLNMGGFKVTNVLAGTSALDAVNKTQLDAATTGVQARVVSKAANYTALDADYGASIQFTTAATLAFDTTANLRTNWRVEVWNNSAGLVPIDPASTDTINGASTLILQPGQWAEVIKTGATTFRAIVFGDPQSGPQLQGYSTGLALTTNGSDAANDVDIAVGAAAADTSPYYLMQLTSSLTKRIDASWAVGTNQGGLDTGSVGNNTYYIWEIQRSDTGVTDVLFSLSSTAPTMPTSYDRKRLIGFVVRASATNGGPVSLLGNVKLAAPVALSGTAQVITGIPIGVKRITIMFDAITVSASASSIFRWGTSAGIVSTGYDNIVQNISGGGTPAAPLTSSAGHRIDITSNANVNNGMIVINRLNGNTWIASGSLWYAGTTTHQSKVTLPGEFDRIQLTTTAGTSTLSGTLSISWEF